MVSPTGTSITHQTRIYQPMAVNQPSSTTTNRDTRWDSYTFEKTYDLGRLKMPRLLVGLWQLSSPSWGTAPSARIRRAMLKHVQSGYNAFDMADHYGTAEQIFGQFRETLKDRSEVIGATKWCVFKPTRITRTLVEEAIKERNERMCSDHVDLLQFHWNDYEDKAYLDALKYLKDLRTEGRITEIGLVNFDAARTEEIVIDVGPGIIVSNQVAFSLIDTRPLDGMGDVCERHGVKLLTYGTLCGGFLSDKYLGQPEPDEYSDQLTPSQRKYLDVIVNTWGTWPLFQELLSTLRSIGDKYGRKSISNVATRWVLEHPFVGSVIIGNRLGVSDHLEDNDAIYAFRLSPDDKTAIERVLDKSNSRSMIRMIGDCGAEYRTTTK